MNDKKRITTSNGHCWITFDNGYTLSIFNGFGGFSDNYFNEEARNNIVTSNTCEIAILGESGIVYTELILKNDSLVKGDVTVSELVEIINIINGLEREGVKNEPNKF